MSKEEWVDVLIFGAAVIACVLISKNKEKVKSKIKTEIKNFCGIETPIVKRSDMLKKIYPETDFSSTPKKKRYDDYEYSDSDYDDGYSKVDYD